eukprot:scaffold174761_cov18-Tisochrysis_lutea.AAC.1
MGPGVHRKPAGPCTAHSTCRGLQDLEAEVDEFSRWAWLHDTVGFLITVLQWWHSTQGHIEP